MKRSLRILIIFLIFASTFGCDQISKSIVRQTIDKNENIHVLKHYVMLRHVENKGAFLSAGNSLPPAARILLLIVIPVLVLVYALCYILLQKNVSATVAYSICLIISGGVGNIYDRIVHGTVTDFMYINFIIFETGIFNVADVAIMAGVIVLLCSNLKQYITQVRQ